jgi:hypothetical protein
MGIARECSETAVIQRSVSDEGPRPPVVDVIATWQPTILRSLRLLRMTETVRR